MGQKTWFITGVSSGFGKEIAKQALEHRLEEYKKQSELAASTDIEDIVS